MKEILWHNLTVQQTLKELKSDFLGLSRAEANKRLLRHGQNLLPKKKPLSRLEIVVNQFKSALIYVLLIAGLISFMLGEAVDATVIFIAVFFNVVIGYLQEHKAQNALLKLAELVTPTAKVIREGREEVLPARQLAVGDVIFLEAGDKVPADARLLEVKSLETMESALTGEPQTVAKSVEALFPGTVLAERNNLVYTGTIVVAGRGQAVVVATALKTQLGRIAKLIRELKEEPTPLQKKLNHFSRHLSLLILLLSLVIFILGLMQGKEFLTMFNTVVALAVAAIPEGLVISVTVILAIGMQRILRQQALTRKLLAAETLGSTTVICTDKTGTLTEGEMRVVRLVTASSQLLGDGGFFQIANQPFSEVCQLLKIALLCNDGVILEKAEDGKLFQILGSATERALLLMGLKSGFAKAELEKENPRLDEILFDSSRKFMATLHPYNKSQNIIYFKGAPEIILNAAANLHLGERAEKIYQPARKDWQGKIEALSKEGLRVLGFAYKIVDKTTENFKGLLEPLAGSTWVGLVGLKDPLRPEVKETLALTKKAGLTTVMITGDNKLTAKAIAKELDLDIKDENILEGEKLSKLNDEELAKKVKEIKIYARVTPTDKLRIVEAWQKQGAVVAMTGDGINDAPALKRADIGVALGSGSEVAKEAASLILLDNSFKAIVAAVREGRIIYDNIKKVILYLLSDSFSEMIIVMGSLALGWPLPLLPTQILWINLVTDGFPNVALTFEPGEQEVMNESPQERDKPILDKERFLLIIVISLLTGLTSLGLFFFFWKVIGDLDLARTIVFAALGLDSLLYVFSCRTLRHSLFNFNFLRNKYLLGAVIIGALWQLSAIYLPYLQHVLKTVPLGLNEWGAVLSVCLTVVLAIEIIKRLYLANKIKS